MALEAMALGHPNHARGGFLVSAHPVAVAPDIEHGGVAHETVETGAATTRSAETRPQSEKPRLEIKISEPRE